MAGSCFEWRDYRTLAFELELDRADHVPFVYDGGKRTALQLCFELGLVCQRHHDRAFWFDDFQNSRAILRFVSA